MAHHDRGSYNRNKARFDSILMVILRNFEVIRIDDPL
jgi:hypothetical protein